MIDFHADPRNIILAFIIGGYKIGYAIRGFGFLLNKVVPFNENQHQIQINLDLVRSIGADSDEQLDFFISKKDEVYVNKLLVHIERDFIILNPGASRKSKRWIDKNWSSLADKLFEQYNYKIILTGTKSDFDEIEKIIKNMKHKKNVRNLSGKTSINSISECE